MIPKGSLLFLIKVHFGDLIRNREVLYRINAQQRPNYFKRSAPIFNKQFVLVVLLEIGVFNIE